MSFYTKKDSLILGILTKGILTKLFTKQDYKYTTLYLNDNYQNLLNHINYKK